MIWSSIWSPRVTQHRWQRGDDGICWGWNMASCNEPWVRLLTPCPLPSSAAEHRVLGYTQTHTWAAVSALSLKNETNISPSTIWKVCIFQLLPSATLGLNLRGYVFLFKHAVHIHLFRPRAFGLHCAGYANSEGTARYPLTLLRCQSTISLMHE